MLFAAAAERSEHSERRWRRRFATGCCFSPVVINHSTLGSFGQQQRGGGTRAAANGERAVMLNDDDDVVELDCAGAP